MWASPITSWPVDFPGDFVVLRRAPYEARADSVMYRQVLGVSPVPASDAPEAMPVAAERSRR